MYNTEQFTIVTILVVCMYGTIYGTRTPDTSADTGRQHRTPLIFLTSGDIDCSKVGTNIHTRFLSCDDSMDATGMMDTVYHIFLDRFRRT